MAKILILDDSEIARLVAAKIIDHLNHEADVVAKPDEALRMCAEKQYALVFADWDLPSLGALDFLKGLHGLHLANPPITAACFTENDPKQVNTAKAAGARFKMMKPYEVSSVREIIRTAGLEPAPAYKFAAIH